jgi:DNA-binding NtrC family response regulator
MTYDQALRLFRRGHFRQLVESATTADQLRQSEPNLRVLIGYALALAGDINRARSVLAIEATRLPNVVRSQFESSIGIINWRAGDAESAWKHLNIGVQAATDSKDLERIAWAHLHLLRFTVDARPIEALRVMLPRARAATIDAGVPAVSAYLHTCVTTIEGSRGHFDEALRHCDIAESLLEMDPNAWVSGVNLVNKGCIASVQCDVSIAAEYFRRAIAISETTGSLRTRTSAETNLGYLQFVVGQFRRAEATLTHVLSDTENITAFIDASDFLARLYLSEGDLERCDQTLERLNLYGHSGRYPEYATRWAALTKAKLLLKRGDFRGAVTWLDTIEVRSSSFQDAPFSSAVHLLAAFALHQLGEQPEGARRFSSELRGLFHYLVGRISGRTHPHLAAECHGRAERIWSNHGVVSVPLEFVDKIGSLHEPIAQPKSQSKDDIKAVINCFAAAFDVAASPALLGQELLRAIKLSGCLSESTPEIVDSASDALPSINRRILLPLGDSKQGGKTLCLRCDSPRFSSDAITLGDIMRIGNAAMALEKARQDERGRAALWPSNPVEYDTSALYIAKEMQALLDTARTISRTDIPVLVTGETGTGKEVLARLIHSHSPRAAKTFLPFNCSASPRDMLDAQLFGHRRGAFTGATENFQGVIRAAAGGTLFLDEIGESTLDIQPKLLRFLESGEVHPIGETHPQRVDVRIIAATNADVDALVAQGRFREDLYYRLNIVRLHIPPLRERRVEIPVFANHYLQKYAKEMHKGELRLAEETMEYLVLYRWPGNVRQIANEMRRLAALAEHGAVLMPEHLSRDIAASRRTVPAAERTLDACEIVVRIDQPLIAATQHVEQTMIKAAIEKTNSVDEAAKLLGLSRKGLYLKRLRFGMAIERTKDDAEATGTARAPAPA